jgi:hypothetical protein
MEHPVPGPAGWRSAVGSSVALAGSAACAVAVGVALVRHRSAPWVSPIVPWLLGLALAGALALVAPPAWMDRWLAARERRGPAAALLGVFLAVEVTMAWLGYLTFRHYSWDFNLYVELLQETLRGYFFARPGQNSFLGQFWAPQIAVWLPLWLVWPDPRMLLLVQVAAYGAMALAVYSLAELRLGPGPWPFSLTAAVILAPTKDWARSSPYGVTLYEADVLLVQRGADASANRRLARWLVGAVADPAALPREIGVVVRDLTARADHAVRAPRKVAGLALYGWYTSACPGRYELSARLRFVRASRAGPLGRLEVTTDAGTRVLAERTLDAPSLDPAEYRDLTLPFTVAEALTVEARLHSTGAGIFQVDGRPPHETCEAERSRS